MANSVDSAPQYASVGLAVVNICAKFAGTAPFIITPLLFTLPEVSCSGVHGSEDLASKNA